MTKDDVTLVMPTRNRLKLVTQALVAIRHRPLYLAVSPGEEGGLPVELMGATVMRTCPYTRYTQKFHDCIVQSETKLFLAICDDIDWALFDSRFLDFAIECFNRHFPDGYGVVRLNNGDPNEFMGGYFLMARQFYWDHCHFPDYEFQAFDWELTFKALLLGRYAYCPEALLPHLELSGRRDHKPDNMMMRKRLAEFLIPRLRVTIAGTQFEITTSHERT